MSYHITAVSIGLFAATAGAQVFSPFASGDLGGEYLLDEAAVGGADVNNATGVQPFTAFEMTGLFNVGDDVSVTGLALPLWANNTTDPNTTLNGTFTFNFYSLSGGGNAERFDGLANEALLGTATLEFTSEGTGVMVFGGLFSDSVDFTADSTGFAFSITSTAEFRMKMGPQPASATRVNINNGNRTTGVAGGATGNITIIGTAIPAPGSALALAAGCFAMRRRR